MGLDGVGGRVREKMQTTIIEQQQSIFFKKERTEGEGTPLPSRSILINKCRNKGKNL